MNKFKKIICTFFALLMVISAGSVVVSAGSAYQTYVYDVYGEPLYSPNAYEADVVLDSRMMNLGDVALSNPRDMVTDAAGNVYIADTDNNRIVVLDSYYKLLFTIDTFSNEWGNTDALVAPEGLYVTEPNKKYATRMIWVCDTGKNRIVLFNDKGEFVRVIEEPQLDLVDDNALYTPVALAVDVHNRLYVVSSTTREGVIVMTEEGEFNRFVGAQAVTMSAWEIIWRKFQTKEQRENSEEKTSIEYSNITINTTHNLVYAVVKDLDPALIEGAILGKDTTGTNSPVKLLNPMGDEKMRRTGFWMPVGEIDYMPETSVTAQITGPSQIIDVAVGPENTWSLIDAKRQRIYTYDFEGNLLFAFGDSGTQMGNMFGIEAIAYQGNNILVLDKTKNNITVFERTPYGDTLLSAIAAENAQDYDLAINLWSKVLQANSNFDPAYVGIGKAMYRNKDYKNSLAYFESAYDTENWSNSYKEIRKEWMSDYFLVLLLIIIVLIVGVTMFFSTMGKINRKAALGGRRKRTFGQEIAYGFYVIFHPFDGFWDLKHEKRGSVRGATFFVVLAIATFYYQAIGSGYLMDPFSSTASIWAQLLGVLVPLFLFVLANWCLTTLFEGEGSFKDIYVAGGYCLVPIPLLIIPATVYSNFCISSEVEIVTMLGTIAFIWMGLLIFLGTMVTHDYSMGKNVVTVLGTIVGMVFIMFIAVLFTTLVGKIVSLITNIVDEIQYRL